MKLRNYFTAIAVMACGSLFAQNATKADLDKLTNQVNVLSQKMTELENKATMFETKVAQLEADVERIVTENVNLVEQLNVKTVTSYTDKNRIQWDIVRVEPNPEENTVTLILRISNNSGVSNMIMIREAYAIDTNSNLSNNKYSVNFPDFCQPENGIPLNIEFTIKQVPTTCSYLASVYFQYSISGKHTSVKFTGVHIPW